MAESFGPELNRPAGDRHGADEGEAEASGIEEEKDEGKPPSGIGALGVTYAVSGGGTECRICLMDDGAMCSPCDCSGSTQFVHLDCLARWCRETGAVTCELCNGALPSHFIDAGKTVRRARAAQEAERREAAERLERLTSTSSSRTADPRAGPWITPSSTSTAFWRPKRRSVDACTSEVSPRTPLKRAEASRW